VTTCSAARPGVSRISAPAAPAPDTIGR
jgi:hypothetical protein